MTEKTTQISARISLSLHQALCERAERDGKTQTEIQQDSLRAYLENEPIAAQLARIENGMLAKIFAVVCAVANLSADERRAAKSVLKSILTAEVGQ